MDIRIDDKEDLVWTPSGESVAMATQVLAPDDAELRWMLAELRKGLAFSVAKLAATLGVPRITLRSWFDGTRRPSGAARRLIWVLYTAHFAPETFREPAAWMLWTRPQAPTTKSQ